MATADSERNLRWRGRRRGRAALQRRV